MSLEVGREVHCSILSIYKRQLWYCLFLSLCVGVSVAPATNLQTLKLIKMPLSHAADLQRLQFRDEKRVGGGGVK